MEVHHPHHLSHKKKWNEYIIEFLMLFAAVTLGFFAENVREHQVERLREKEFIHTLIEDLKLDKTNLEKDVEIRKSNEANFDTLIRILKSPNYSNEIGRIYYLARIGSRKNHWSYNDRTIQQLRNSGNFRLISNVEISDKILQYDLFMRQVLYLNDHEYNIIMADYRKQVMVVFNPLVFQEMQREDFFEYPEGSPKLFNNDPNQINLLASHAHYVRNHTGLVRKKEIILMNESSKLIEFIKDEYHLK